MHEHHISKTGTINLAKFLNHNFQRSIADAAAMAVVLNLRPLSFSDNQEDLIQYSEAIFVAGQTAPAE